MIFNSLKEIKKYYNEPTNTYVFEEDGDLIELVELNFNLKIYCNIIVKDIKALDIEALDISARDINACNINARDIKAWDINAWDIKACDIDFYAVCTSYKNITCKSIIGRRENAKYLALDGEVIIKEE